MTTGFDTDDFWTACVQRSGSNSVVNGWADMLAYVERGDADERALSGMTAALRGLSQLCQDQLHEKREASRLARYR